MHHHNAAHTLIACKVLLSSTALSVQRGCLHLCQTAFGESRQAGMHAHTLPSEGPNQNFLPRTTSALCSSAYALFCVVKFSVEDDLVPQMRACATHAFSAVLNKLNPMRRQHCFELFGLDFMVDARHKVPSSLVQLCQLAMTQL